MPDRTKTYDVLVAGGGNAALCAAITARQAGASVLLVESAPKAFRGGNSRHTRNLRAMHDQPNEVLTDAYKEDEYWDDLLRVTGGNTDEALARMTIRASSGVFGWMKHAGVRFQPSLTGTLNLGRTNAFFLGGGKALVNAYYLTAEKLGVEILYDTEVISMNMEDGCGALHRHHLQGLSRDDPCALRGGIVRRLPGQPGLDARILGRCGGQLRHPRHAVQPRPGAEEPARPGRRGGRRSDPVPCRGAGRPRAEIRRRHHHASGQRALQRRGQPQRRPVLRRRRGRLAQALCHLGPADRPAARPDRLLDLRCEGVSRCSCRRCSRRSRPTRWKNWRSR